MISSFYWGRDQQKDGNQTAVSVPLTRLPATLGRSHETNDTNFFGLGTERVLSRQQCVIGYRDKYGGQLIMKSSSDSGSKKNGTDAFQYQKSKTPTSAPRIIRRHMDKPLPESGFFFIQCLGKNRIIVDENRVEQGEIALLHTGSDIRMNLYFLKFLLPVDAPEASMKVPHPRQPPTTKKQKKTTPPPPSTAFLSKPSSAGKSKSTGGGNKSSNSKSSAGVLPPAKANYVEQFESTPVQTLIREYLHAVKTQVFERRHQLIGSAITLNAVKDCARDPTIRLVEERHEGLTRGEVMTWISESSRYKEWLAANLTQVEYKSYQANITKSFQRAGFQRNTAVGRFVRWRIPDSLRKEGKAMEDKKKKKRKSKKAADKSSTGTDTGNKKRKIEKSTDTKSSKSKEGSKTKSTGKDKSGKKGKGNGKPGGDASTGKTTKKKSKGTPKKKSDSDGKESKSSS